MQPLQSAFFPTSPPGLQILLEKKGQDVIQVTEALTPGWPIYSPHTRCIFQPTRSCPLSRGPAGAVRSVSCRVAQGHACLWGRKRVAWWHVCMSLSMDGCTHSHNKKYVIRALACQVTEMGHLFADHLMIMHMAIQAQWGHNKCFLKDFVLEGIVYPTTPMSLHTSIRMHGCTTMRNNPVVNCDHGV